MSRWRDGHSANGFIAAVSRCTFSTDPPMPIRAYSTDPLYPPACFIRALADWVAADPLEVTCPHDAVRLGLFAGVREGTGRHPRRCRHGVPLRQAGARPERRGVRAGV